MKQLRLGAQLNISFALVLFVPMIIATVFSIVYYSGKIKEEAVNTISSDMKIAGIICRNAVGEMGHLADAYAHKKIVNFLIGYNLGEKIGRDWAASAELEQIDMITVVDSACRVLVRAHASRHIGDICPRKPYINKALGGETVSGVERLSLKELEAEGLNIGSRLFSRSEKILTMTGAAPLYDRQRENIVGAVIVRRLLNSKNVKILDEITHAQQVYAALFEGVNLIASAVASSRKGEFVPPPLSLLENVLKENQPEHIANISTGGSISKLMPLSDFEGVPVGILMVQTGVDDYLQTRNTAVVALLGVFVVGVILAFSIKTIIERRIVVPVQRLKRGAEKIGGGDYTHAQEVTSGDEIGELTEAFNKMAGDLQQYDIQVKEHHRELENRVKERTAALQIANDQLIDANTVLEDTLETLNPGVSRLIKKNQQKLGLVFATELVADICNYTKLNMILGETMMGEFMKKFFREGHKLLAEYRGMFDKTVGDQIVAIFGTPKDRSQASPIHPFDAVACAIKLVAAAEKINEVLQEAVQDNYSAISARHKSLSKEDRESVRIEDLKFQCRIGINTSNPSSDREIDRMRMVMMGAETCVDYTAQGGAIIYAFRLESSGKPGEIHVGENTRRIVEGVFSLEEIPSITLKGLGTQSRYRVAGYRSLFSNIYPKIRFYRMYRSAVPESLKRQMQRIRLGRIEIPEVKKLNDWVEVDIPYIEHLAGYFNLSYIRALFCYAVGSAANIENSRLEAVIFISLWGNGRRLAESALDDFEAYSLESQVPEDIDCQLVNDIAESLEQKSPEMLEAKIIALSDLFDKKVFDRSFLRLQKNEIISPKEFMSLMKIQGRSDDELLDILSDLMIAAENPDADISEGGETDAPELPDDVERLAQMIRERYTEGQQGILYHKLSEIKEENKTDE